MNMVRESCLRWVMGFVLAAFGFAGQVVAQGSSALSLCGNPRETPERAVRFCTDALRENLTPKQTALVAINLGHALLQLDNATAARDAFDRAVTADPTEARGLGGRAEALEALGRRGEAAVDWNRAVDLAPRSGAMLEGRGAFRLRSGNAAGAALDFEAALRVEPRRTSHRFNLGLALAELGRDAEAERAFARVIADDPRDAGAWLNRGRLRASRDPAGALGDFDRAVALEPEWGLAWFERGLLHDAAGRRGDADADFRRAWELGHRSEFLTERIRAMGG